MADAFINAALHEIKKTKIAYNRNFLIPLIQHYVAEGNIEAAKSQLEAEGFSESQINECLKPHESKE